MNPKIYIVTDMEGISGIRRAAEVDLESSAYQAARKFLCADVNAAIRGAYDAGAGEVVVCDGHGGGNNFSLEDMDPRPLYERPDGGFNLLPSFDGTFHGVYIIGQHAMAGTINAFLDHTQSSRNWFNYSINGRRLGEIGQIATWAGHFDVPVLMLSGDQAACDEIKELLGDDVVTAAVKQGIGREHVRCLHPAKARELIYDGAKQALALVGKPSPAPLKHKLPMTVRLELQRTDLADAMARRPGTVRLDARTLERTVHSQLELLSF